MSATKIIIDILYILFLIIFIIYIIYIIFYFSKDTPSIEINNTRIVNNNNKEPLKSLDSSDFYESGIGGMDEYLEKINREVLALRTMDPVIAEKLGVRPIKGILIYGGPGLGKTLIATEIGKVLNTEPPIIISGPSLISKWIGESEKNVRDIFRKAREDQEAGRKNLHLVIFDEFDSIGVRRNNEDLYGTYNNIVNQLLTMMDGPEALNNILVIAITNRKDSLDDALLRPGRFEVHIEVKPPNELQRRQILEVKTNKLRRNGFLEDEVNLDELALLTENYSGADIEGLINKVVSEMIHDKINKGQPGIISQDDFLNHIVEKSKPVEQDNSNSSYKSIIEKLLGSGGL